MPSLLATILLLSAAPAAGPLEQGALLTYRGQIVASQGEGVETRKLIELSLLVAESNDTSTTLWWSLAEQGRGGFGWTEQFGRIELDARLRLPAAAIGPALLYDRDDGQSVVPLNLPFLVAPQPLAKDAKWSEGGWDYSVEGSEAVGDRQTWQVKVGNRLGRRRNWLVDAASPKILKLREIVFMGQGQEHIVTLDLVSADKLSADATQKVAAAYAALAQLRDTLVPQRRVAEVNWSKEKVEQLKAGLPPVATAASATVVERLVNLAQLDARFQGGRNGAIAALQASMIGKPLGEFSLEDLERAKVDQASLKNQVTVLHFWEYKDTPLEAPYGQIGYLDFLYRKRKADGVQVYGIAVAGRADDDETRRKHRTSARKIREFMNASYPVLLDDGTLIRRMMDPRDTGAKLPLFIVIGRDGKIAEYHVGLYETGRDQGLTQLDAAIKAALDKRE